MTRFCTHCGQAVPDNCNFCTNCGAPVPPPAAPQPQQQYNNPQSNPQPNPQPVQQQPIGNKPKSYLALSIIATVLLFINTCICFPLGIPAIICSARVNKLWKNGQYEESQKASRTAMILAIITLAIGVFYLVYCITHYDEIMQKTEEILQQYGYK